MMSTKYKLNLTFSLPNSKVHPKMKVQLHSLPSKFTFLPRVLLIILCIYVARTTATAHPIFTNETDKLALLAIKGQTSADPFGALDSWNDSLHFCSWKGVNCSLKHQRVASLELVSLNLAGTLSPHIGNLTFLNVINLGDNFFHGIIPQEIGRLARLRHLFLWNNSFQGYVPTNLTLCSKLETFNLMSNELIGEIPMALGSLSRLTRLGLSGNHLTGSIPPSLGNLSFLSLLSLADNNLRGSIPYELSSIPFLGFLQLSANNLSGQVPIGLYNISSLYMFSVTYNKLQGNLPPDIGLSLPSLQRFYAAQNRFSGLVPESLANASKLIYITIAGNFFTGPLPLNFGILQYLEWLGLSGNPLFARSKQADNLIFFKSLTNCSRLVGLEAVQTNLAGIFPDSVSNLSTNLIDLAFGGNYLSGNIPWGVGNLINLIVLAIDYNQLSEEIPNSIGELHQLQALHLNGNMLSGKIPTSFCNHSSLSFLDLRSNMLEETIPSSLGNCTFLQYLDLSSNNLTGVIPEEVFTISSLSIQLNLSRNHLSGPLPQQFGNLKNLGLLDLAENELSGEIPSGLGSCVMLESLYMGGNHFKGSIPSSFEQFKMMQVLDLSRNNLSGPIPTFFGNLSIISLNLSFNDFEGQVPVQGIFANFSAFSIVGNHKLCGGIQQLQLPSCPTLMSSNHKKLSALVVGIIAVIGALACVTLLSASLYVIFYWRKPSKQEKHSPDLQLMMDLSYRELMQATDGFSSANVIGKGSFSSVYKGVLSDGKLIAVKVFNLDMHGAQDSFLAECNALKNTRHRNVVKIIASCSSIDVKGHDFKALVYEFMPNGNLDSWLHPKTIDSSENLHRLNFMGRMIIAIDVANALEYLHHHCVEPVIHCDLKPSNILLDNDLRGHVGDFGLARLANTTSSLSKMSSTGVKGTIGYVPPEYGMNKEVTEQGDMYSYGILLLEMFTGKRPTDSIFNDNLDLRGFVEMALYRDQVMQIIDPQLLIVEEDLLQGSVSSDHETMRGLVSILQIGVMCSAKLPKERLDIEDALREIERVKSSLIRANN